MKRVYCVPLRALRAQRSVVEAGRPETFEHGSAIASVDIVALLLDAAADIEADEIHRYGGKPLHGASEHEPETVKLLLERGANVNARNVKTDSEFYCTTPRIMIAAQKNDCSERISGALVALEVAAEVSIG